MTKSETDALIAEKLTTLTSHADWLRALTIAQTFRQYSLSNRILIAAQCEDPTYVAGFNTWKTLGRSVKKGERAIRIMAPLVKKDRDDPEAPAPVVGFRVVNVFDLGQTVGEPFQVPQATLLTGTHATALLDHLKAVAPVPVEWVDPAVLHGANGDYSLDTQIIRVRNDVEPNQQAKTLLHELAHHFGTLDNPKPLVRDFEECAAESAAFIVAGLHGFDTVAYSAAYVANWAQADSAVLPQLVQTVGVRVAALETLLGQPISDASMAA